MIKAGERLTGARKDGSGNVLQDLVQDDMENMSRILKYATPGIGMLNMTTDVLGGLAKPKPDAKFKDTPNAGVIATPDYNLFEFAPGDRVQASATASGFTSGNDMNSGGTAFAPTIIVNADRDSDVTTIVAEVKAALSQASDTFTAQWDSNRSIGGGGRVASNYG